MAERFGSQTHPSGGVRYGSQTYAAISAAAGMLAAVESGADTFAATVQPTVHATASLVESGVDTLAVSGTSSLSQTMQAHEAATPDGFIATGYVIDGSLRFGSQDHPSGGVRFGAQAWAGLGPSWPVALVESGADTFAGAGWLAGTTYSFAIYDVLASFVDYSAESIGQGITGTLDDGNKVMLPVSTAGVAFTWELNEFGNPSLRLANLTGTTVLSAIPWYVWNGSSWTAATFDVSDAQQGAVFMVETVADTFIGNGSQTRYGSLAATESSGLDSAAFAGSVIIIGAVVAAESTAADTLAATGAPSYAGDVLLIESGADVLAVAGGVVVTGTLAATESAADVFSATGTRSVSGDLAAVESGADTFAGTSKLIVTGNLAPTETGSDTFAGVLGVTVSGALAVAESGADVLAVDGNTARVAVAALVESASDTSDIAGTVEIAGDFGAVESPDIFAAEGVRSFVGIVAVVEGIEGANDRFVATGIQGDLPPVADFDGTITLVSLSTRYTVRSKKKAVAA